MKPDKLKIDRTKKTLRELAYENMRKAIFDAHFPPGARLVERTLCDDLDVSRTVVREVLRQLETEGLVETIPHIGPIVATLEWEQAEQIYEVRGTLEAMAIRACAEQATAKDITHLKALFDSVSDAFNGESIQPILSAKTNFYKALFTIGKKHFAWEIVSSLNDRITQLRSMTTGMPGRYKQAIPEIKEIIDAIEQNDADKAVNASWSHVNKAAEIAKQLLKQKELDD